MASTGIVDVIGQVVDPLVDALSTLTMDCVTGQVTPEELDSHSQRLSLCLQVTLFWFGLLTFPELGPNR